MFPVPKERERKALLPLNCWAEELTTLSQEFSTLDPVNLDSRQERDESHGGCQVNGPKVAKFLDR